MTGPALPRPLFVTLAALCLLIGSFGAVSVPSLLPMWIVIGAIVAGAAYIVVSDRASDEQSPPTGRTIRRRTALAGAATTAACLVLTGIVSIVGPGAGTPIVLLVLLVFGLWMWRGRPRIFQPAFPVDDGAESDRPAPPPPPETPELLPVAGEMATPALCRAWQRSYFALLDVPDGPAKDDITTWRCSILDELERRDPVGFDHWMRSGARAGSDPSRYLDLTTDH